MASFEKNLKINEAIRAIDNTTVLGVTNTAIKITAQAKELCPVADYFGGNLKGSIQWESDGKSGGDTSGTSLTEKPSKNGAIVGTPVEYGVYQEFGTRKMNAQPFLRPAVDIVANGKSGEEAMATAFRNTVPRELKKA